MNKIITSLALSGAIALLAACGGTTESGTPAPTAKAVSKPSPIPTPTPVVLTRADIGQKVEAVLKKQGTYRMTFTDPADKSYQAKASVKHIGARQDFSITAEDDSVVAVGGQYYYLDSASENESMKWVKYNPKAKGAGALTSVLIKLYEFLIRSPRLLAGAPSATKFVTTAGPMVDSVPTTKYAMILDVNKAVAAKSFGDYLTVKAVDDEKMLPVTAVVDRDGLLRKLDFGVGKDTTSIVFSNFGDSVFIGAPAPDQIKR